MTRSTRRRKPHPPVDPLARLQIIIGLVHGGLESWQPKKPEHRRKRIWYMAEALDCFRQTVTEHLSAREIEAIEKRMEAIARWRNRITD